MLLRLIGYLLMGAAVLLVAAVFYRNSGKGDVPLIFSPVQMLNATWLDYKDAYLDPNTYRTIDRQRDNVTTSEGQSYTMLRAVWIGDKKTFDGAWKWTQTNLYHTNDQLFAWLWGLRPDGTYGVLTAQHGETSASDADTDIALSLTFAYARWQDPVYLSAAQKIIGDIWSKEVVVVQGVPYITADNLEASSTGYAAINLSYLNPAAYRIFQRVDPSHPWLKVVDSSYALLQQSITSPLDKSSSAGLPPNWATIDKSTGIVKPTGDSSKDTNFGFDALRVPYHLSLDWEWFKDPRDQLILGQLSFLNDQWNKNQKLVSTYGHDGTTIIANETPAMYGGTIGYFAIAASSSAKNVYEKKLAFLYDPGAYKWKEQLSYYDDNWAWFGIALYNHELPNLEAQLPVTAFKQ